MFGIEIGACGNGTRCVAYLVYQENNQKKISIKIKENILNAEVVGKQNVKINMGKPKFGWKEIPLSENIQEINFDQFFLKNGLAVSMGNPHIVFFVIFHISKLPLFF